MRPFTSAYHFWAIYGICPSCISALWHQGWRQILATSPDPETHSHPSLCLATALLQAGRSLHLMGGTSGEVTRSDTPFTENPRALLSSLFASNLSAANGNTGRVLSDKAGCSVVSRRLTTSGRLPAIMRWCSLYCFPDIPRRAMAFIGVEF